MSFKFWVEGKPVAQGSMTSYGRGRMVHANPELVYWRELVGWAAREAMGERELYRDVPMALRLTFVLPRPKSARRDKPHVKPDLDKLARGALDAMEGIVYWQDAQVTTLQVSKTYGTGHGTGLEVYVEPLA